MPSRFLTPVNIFAQRISYQSTCVKIRTTFSASAVSSSETKSDYYSEEFSIRTSGKISNNSTVGSVPSKYYFGGLASSSSSSSSSFSTGSSGSQFIKEANQNRMPVVAAVVAHRRIYPAAASSLASSTAGSQRSSCAATARHLSAVSFVSPMPLGLTGIIKRSSHHSTSKFSAGSGIPAKSVGGGGGFVSGRSTGRPLVELKQLGRLLNAAAEPPLKGSAILVESRRAYAKGKDKPKSKKTNVVFNENEVGEVIDVDNFKKQLEKLKEQMKEDYTKQLSIRGAAGALESLEVEFEGEVYPLQELAQVGRKNPQLAILNLASLPDAIKPVIKAIEESGMNLNPQQEGTTIYVPLPKVTREHRETLAKNAKALFMKYKVEMQGVQNKYVKQCKNQTDISEDLVYSVTQQVMKYTESVIAEAEGLMHLKQKELLENK